MRPFLLLLSSFLLTASSAQPFNWQWSVSATSTVSTSDVQGMATDAEGNSYITGTFYGTATFGSLPPITSAGQSDVFVVKYDNAGNALWAARAGGSDFELVGDLDVDGQGHVVITGSFQSTTAGFGPTSLARVGLIDVFVAQLSADDGSFTWAKRFGSNDFSTESTERGNAIACDATGNIYVTGCFRYALTVPDLPTLDGCSQYYTAFLLKLDNEGNGLWSRRPECTHDWSYGASEGQRIDVSPSGDVFLGLRIRGDSIFYETDTLINTQTSGQAHDVVIARYDGDGDYQWSLQIGAYGYDDVEGLSADADGYCYAAIHREGSYTFPGVQLDFAGNFGYYKNVLLKLSPQGAVIWGDRLGNSTYDHGITGFELDDLGHLYLGGWYDGHFEIGGIEPLPNTFGFAGLYVARFDTSDVMQEIFASRHSLARGVRGLGLDGGDNVYIAGYFRDTLAFPALPTLAIPGSGMFVARSGDFSTMASILPEAKDGVRAYPLPSGGRFTLQSERPFTEVRITNALGAVVLQETFATTGIRTCELPANGVYFYTLLDQRGHVATGRMVVQH